jgi:hypothetical protein
MPSLGMLGDIRRKQPSTELPKRQLFAKSHYSFLGPHIWTQSDLDGNGAEIGPTLKLTANDSALAPTSSAKMR